MDVIQYVKREIFAILMKRLTTVAFLMEPGLNATHFIISIIEQCYGLSQH